MGFLSEDTKKERRNLLAAGFVGIIVAQLKVYPKELDKLGMKFHSDDLPTIVIGSLLTAILYFLIKFSSSYWHEKSDAVMKLLATQIREGNPAIDVAKEENKLMIEAQNLLENRKAIEEERDKKEKRILALQDKIDEEEKQYLEELRQQKRELPELENSLNANPTESHVPTPDGLLTPRAHVIQRIEDLKRNPPSYSKFRKEERLKEIQTEKANAQASYEAQMGQAGDFAWGSSEDGNYLSSN